MKGVGGNPVLDAYQRMAITQVGQATPVRGTTPVATPSGNAEHAEVSISSQARGLANGGAEAPVNAEKVADLQARVAAGNFQIDTQLIAQRIIDRTA